MIVDSIVRVRPSAELKNALLLTATETEPRALEAYG